MRLAKLIIDSMDKTGDFDFVGFKLRLLLVHFLDVFSEVFTDNASICFISKHSISCNLPERIHLRTKLIQTMPTGQFHLRMMEITLVIPTREGGNGVGLSRLKRRSITASSSSYCVLTNSYDSVSVHSNRLF